MTDQVQLRGAKWGSALLGLAMLIYLGANHLGRRDPVAVSFPIDLRLGVTRSPTFQADYAEDYEIGLQANRALPHKITRCLLGDTLTAIGGATPEPCPEGLHSVELEWTLFEAGRAIDRGATVVGQPGSYGQDITREFGKAKLRPGRSYMIEVRSLRDTSALAPAHPRVKLEVHPMVWLNEWQWRSFVALGALVLAALSAFSALSSIVAWLWSRRRLDPAR